MQNSWWELVLGEVTTRPEKVKEVETLTRLLSYAHYILMNDDNELHNRMYTYHEQTTQTKKERKKEGRKERKNERKEGRKEKRKKERKEGRKNERKKERKEGRKKERKEGRNKERKKEGKKRLKEGRKEGRKKERKKERKKGRTFWNRYRNFICLLAFIASFLKYVWW